MYFPRFLNNVSIKTYKPFILSIILDPRFKIVHFKENGLLNFYDNIHRDITKLLKTEYNQ
jgi:hypothetical protein